MKRRTPLFASTVPYALRIALAAGAIVALFATVGPPLEPLARAARPGQVADGPDRTEGGPLDGGYWRTIANGDRVNALILDGDVLWSATDGGGLVRWNLSEDPKSTDDSYEQLLHPQDGLPSNRINDMLLDPSGLLWLATERGLVRFDPATRASITYSPENSDGMPSRVVRTLLRRDDGRMWIGFGQEWDREMPNPHPQQDELGAYRPGGLALFDPASSTWSYEIHPETRDNRFLNIPSENISDLAFDSDGNLWIATRQYFIFDRTCQEADECIEGWVLAGGGVVASDLDAVMAGGGSVEDVTFVIHRPQVGDRQASGTCLSTNVSVLEPDRDGRMWVGTYDRGLLLFELGMRQVSCTSLPYYRPVARGGPVSAEGLRGRHVYDVAIDSQDRVWIAHGSGDDEGEGIAILTHNNTFTDSSGSATPWNSDDRWEFLTFDGLEDGGTDALITALVLKDDDTAYLGTRSERFGDGYGIRRLMKGDRRWIPLRTADDGLPSNQLSDVKVDPRTGDVWFALARKGVAMFDGDDWHWWRAFGAGRQVATISEPARSGLGRIPVDIPDRATYDQIFSQRVNFIKIGDDSIRYRVIRYRPENSGIGPFIDIQPDTGRRFSPGTPIFLTERGPASNQATEIAFGMGDDRNVYVGGRESIWMSDRECGARAPECWLDGGLGAWDGETWTVWDQTQPIDSLDGTGLTDQEVRTLAVDQRGRVWVGTGDPSSSQGDGISILDPATETFEYYFLPLSGNSGLALGSNGIGDLSLDPQSGDMWVAHFPSKKLNRAPDGTLSQVFFGGGVSHFDGEDWEFWRKGTGALLKGHKDGTFDAVLADRSRDRVWAGGWDGDRNFHWINGEGVNAVLNWCPLADCRNESWSHREWLGQGEVRALNLDADGRLWTGVHRRGLGPIPPVSGLRVWDDQFWYVYTPENSGIVSHEIESLDRSGDEMWVGTLSDGVSVFNIVPPPTPTPRNSATPRPTATRTPTIEIEPTSTPVGTRASATATRRATSTPRPPGSGPVCRHKRWPGWCDIFLPLAQRRVDCRVQPCGRPMDPTPIRMTATPVGQATEPPGSPSPSATPTLVRPTASRTPTGVSATATATGAASATPGATLTSSTTPSPTVSATIRPSATPSPTATMERPPIGEWTEFNATRSLTRETLNGVHGVSNRQVVMVGENSTVLIWDGVEMTSGSAVGGRTLNRVFMLDSRVGFIAGDRLGSNATMLSTTTGGQQWRINQTSHIDDWTGVSAIRGSEGTVGWLVGRDRGTRLMYDGIRWQNQSSGDLNNASHEYSDVAMITEDRAVAIQGGRTGSRIYEWDGTEWAPGPVSGALFDLHVRSATSGIAVGERGRIWRIDAAGEWEQMSDRPQTAGRDLNGVHAVADDLIWVVGERGGMWLWDGAAWTSRVVPGVNENLRGIWMTEDGRDGWVVGADGAILRYEVPE